MTFRQFVLGTCCVGLVVIATPSRIVDLSAQSVGAPQSQFAGTANLTEVRADHTATSLSDGRVLVTGGQGAGGILRSAEIFNPTTEMFERVGDMVSTHADHTATLLPNGQVLIVGGGVAELFDPLSGSFRLTQTQPAEWRFGHTATLLQDGRVLIAGNATSESTAGASTELFDPGDETFVPGPSMSIPRYWHTATLLNDGSVLLAGGRAATLDPSGTSATAERYMPELNTFEPVGDLGAPRARHTATLLNDGRVLVAGGETIGFVVNQSADVYDPQHRIFDDVGPMNRFRAAHTATRMIDGKVLLTGGAWGGDSAELFDPVASSFELTGNLTHPREEHAGVLLVDGRVLVTGGFDFTTPGPGPSGETQTAELFGAALVPFEMTLDRDRTVTLRVEPSVGGVLQTAAADGTWLTLEIPPDALASQDPVDISLTPVSSMTGLPVSATFQAGAYFEPEGLQLFKPARLTIDLPDGTPIEDPMGIANANVATAPYFSPIFSIDAAASAVVFEVLHFSGQSTGRGSCAVPGNPAGALDVMDQRIACVLSAAQVDQLLGSRGSFTDSEIAELHAAVSGAFHDGVLPGLNHSTDRNGLLSALARYINWSNRRQELFDESSFEGEIAAAHAAVSAVIESSVRQLNTECLDAPDDCQKRALLVSALDWQAFAQTTRDRFGLFGVVVPEISVFCNRLLEILPESITLTPDHVAITSGETFMLTAVLANAAGDAVNGAVGWSTDNDRVATVDQQGRITAGIAGEATITATAGCKASATVGVTVGALTADPEEFLLAIGESVTVAVRDASGNALPPAAIQWTSSHENVATVDSNGAVMARNLGAATLTGRVRATGAIATSHVTTFVNLPDAALNAAVRSALGIAPLQLITLEIADRLGRLEAPGRGIVSLTGIQYFPKLEYLFLERNGIADLAVLATMGQLRSLSVRRNPLSNILPLVGLRNLTGLDISETNVADISPLAQMTQLTLLQIDKLGLSRLDTIAWLRALEWLDFGSNAVKDLTPLAGLTELRVLQGPANHVSDISPLASLRKLDSLVLSVNRIADISALANLTQLTFVNLIRNDIASVAPLAGLTRLRFLSLEENRITDIEPLVANPGIGAGDIISLAKNYLTDGFHVRPKPRANPLQVDSCGGDTTDCDDFAALLDRGVRVTGQWPAFQNEVQCFKGEPRLVKKGDQVCRLPRP